MFSQPSSHNLASGISRKLLILIDVLLYFLGFQLKRQLLISPFPLSIIFIFIYLFFDNISQQLHISFVGLPYCGVRF